MKSLKGKILIIPDIHQCIKFADTVLKKADEVDHIVFLGDYFDCFETPDGKNYVGIPSMCEWLVDTKKKLGDKATWLIGNHDLAYLANWGKRGRDTFYSCSGWEGIKSLQMAESMSRDVLVSLELCVEANGYILSHAGFQLEHFNKTESVIDGINRLYQEWEEDKVEFPRTAYHWIWGVGYCRGGFSSIGSPIWCDFNAEFIPMGEVNQIVGHTCGRDYRENEGNYCIDAYRTTYCILEPNLEKPNILKI